MRRAMIAAAVIAISLPAYAEESTRHFLDRYGGESDVKSRLYLKGVGEGMAVYNAKRQLVGPSFYCPPEDAGIVESQYFAILRDFAAKIPKALELPVEVTLLYALTDAFPCKSNSQQLK